MDLSWTAPAGGAPAVGYEYVVDQNLASPAGAGTATTNTSFTTGNTLLPATTYYLHVRTDCGNGNFSAWVEISFITDPPPCQSAANLTSNTVTVTTGTISWDAVPGAVSYEYVLDTSAAAPIGAGTITTDTFYNATGLVPGLTYYFHLRTNCSGTTQSPWQSQGSLPTGGIGMVNNANFSVIAQPNPVSSILIITVNGTVKGKAHLVLTDIAGKEIMTRELENNQSTFDMAGQAQGVYFIHYADDAHVETIKINKQ